LFGHTYSKSPSMSNLKASILCFTLSLAFSAVASAQDHSCTLNAGGGWSPAVGKEGSNLNAGWNFQAGGGFALTEAPKPGHEWSFFLTANFMYDDLAVSQSALQTARTLNTTNVGLLAATSGIAKFYTLTLDPTFRFPVGQRANVYVLGGFGFFRRDLQFSGSTTEGSLLQPVSQTVFGSGGNSGGFDAGGGVNFKLANTGLMVYAEARVVHGLGINTSNTLIPISAGIRW